MFSLGKILVCYQTVINHTYVLNSVNQTRECVRLSPLDFLINSLKWFKRVWVWGIEFKIHSLSSFFLEFELLITHLRCFLNTLSNCLKAGKNLNITESLVSLVDRV